MKKVSCIIICILFISSVFSVSANISIEKTYEPTLHGNILYVGGSGPGNYSTIQEAVDDSIDGDTIFVYDDSSPYVETLIIDKSINLFGEDKHTTIIDGDRADDSDVIHIIADGVTIKEFTITGSDLTGGWPEHNCGIDIRSHNNTIKDNIIIDNHIGIEIGGELGNASNNNIIQGNIVTNNNEFGVYIVWSRNNLIKENRIDSNQYHGIFLHSESNNNIIIGNNISSHSQVGIWIFGADNNTVKHNIVMNNRDGVLISSAQQNTIVENNIYNNKINALMDGDTLGLLLDKWLDNIFDGNYWGRPLLFPKRIFSLCALILPNFIWSLIFQLPPIFIPLVVFDKNPAQEPYDI